MRSHLWDMIQFGAMRSHFSAMTIFGNDKSIDLPTTQGGWVCGWVGAVCVWVGGWMGGCLGLLTVRLVGLYGGSRY